MDYLTKGQLCVGLWWFLCCSPQQNVEHMVELMVIGHATNSYDYIMSYFEASHSVRIYCIYCVLNITHMGDLSCRTSYVSCVVNWGASYFKINMFYEWWACVFDTIWEAHFYCVYLVNPINLCIIIYCFQFPVVDSLSHAIRRKASTQDTHTYIPAMLGPLHGI